MTMARYVHWQDEGMWLGYFEEFPDYMTQGESLEELQQNLRDLYSDLTSGGNELAMTPTGRQSVPAQLTAD